MKVNISGLIDSIEFCGIHATKECSVRPIFLGSELAKAFDVFRWDHYDVGFVL